MVATYEVTVFTGDADHASTFHDVFIILVGKESESECKKLQSQFPYFHRGDKLTVDVESSEPLGEILGIKLQKKRYLLFPDNHWFPDKVEVTTPTGDIYQIPIYQWITDFKVHFFRVGKAVLLSEETIISLRNLRKQELHERQEVYCWEEYRTGLPHCMKAESLESLPLDVRFSSTKKWEMFYTIAEAMVELGLKFFLDWTAPKKKWTKIGEIDRPYRCHQTATSDYVHKHWRDDDFFGYQFLNGVNPMMIQCCETLPTNFPVDKKMILQGAQRSLEDEMKQGNIFLCDYKILDGVKANIIHDKQQYLAAPLVLLHKTPDDKLMPIAIQLKQDPAEDNPIFFPTDSEWDWLLAKTFVRNADFNVHELNAHLLHTHLLAEVFAVALMRNLPMVHPLYKLLIPHTRYTMMINFSARDCLISQDGVFTKFASSGGEGMLTIMTRSLSSVTYRSLCLPDDIADRGLEDVPNFYYRDDGLKLWNIINRFVQEILEYYYKNDKMVETDDELQAWIHDIFQNGFLSNKDTGIPETLKTVDELVKFVTMVIFTCSAQHSAVNSGQYDFIGWMPNSPVSLERPLPTTKGEANEITALETFPDICTTVHGMAVVWLLSKHSSKAVFLGDYPEERFTEEIPLEKKKIFKEELNKLSEEINERNKNLSLPYIYLDPKKVENSVSL